jgi:Zn-finger nucleic acid-binding protein
MTCENCGAPATLDQDKRAFVCGYCASELGPDTGDDGVHILRTTGFKCPDCDSPLGDGTLEARPLLYCETCRGMLIPMGEFGGLIEALRAHRDRPAAVLPPRSSVDVRTARACPRCSHHMDNHFYGGPGNVVIDTCERCSANWLDKAELQRIVSASDYSPNIFSGHDAYPGSLSQPEDNANPFD